MMKTTEILIISVVWIVLIAAPVLFNDSLNGITWESFSTPLETLIPLLVVFLINRFLLVPGFLFRRKKVHYVCAAFILIAIVTGASFLFSNQMQVGQFQPPPPPPPITMSTHQPPPSFSTPSSSFKQNPPLHPRPIPLFMNVLIFSVLLVGFDTGLRVAVRLTKSEQEKAILEKEHIETQLTMLRNQVSPHFFMNTLNNIHALIDINTTEAKDAVIRLSNLMRYLLYESTSGKTSLKSELEFVESYIDLMKLRYTNDVRIILNVPGKVPDKMIPPFLFTALIENAFKHGISYKTKSYIFIDFIIDDNQLVMRVKNSIVPQESETEGSPSGIGLTNTRKRLDLQFGHHYRLDVLNNGTEFNVNLSIPI